MFNIAMLLRSIVFHCVMRCVRVLLNYNRAVDIRCIHTQGFPQIVCFAVKQ